MTSKGYIPTLEHRLKVKAAMLGKRHTQQTRDFIARAANGRLRDTSGRFAAYPSELIS